MVIESAASAMARPHISLACVNKPHTNRAKADIVGIIGKRQGSHLDPAVHGVNFRIRCAWHGLGSLFRNAKLLHHYIHVFLGAKFGIKCAWHGLSNLFRNYIF